MIKKKIATTSKYLKSFYIRDFLLIAFGLMMFTVGFTGFILPNEVVTGGLSGIAAIVKYTQGIDMWISTLAVNAVLLAFAFRVVSKQFVVKTIIGVGILAFFFNLGETYIQPYFTAHPPLSDTLLSAIMGGILAGSGLGLVYSVNGSAGGTDIIGFLVTKYFRISLARILLIVDVLVVVSSYFILEKKENTLEKTVIGLILLPLMWHMVDVVLNGARQSVQIFIFSKQYEEIATHINSEIKRGCTVVDGMGWYSKNPQKVIIVIARRTEANSIFRLVNSIDSEAFVTQANVMGVYGNGFDKLR